MQLRAWVIVNRRARRLGDGSAILREQCRAGATMNIATVETRSLEELDAAALRIAREAPDVPVILAGGDGSHAAGLTALGRALGDRLPPIALAPGGTVNTVARGWGMRGDPVAYTRRLLDAVVAGTAASTRRSTLRVTSPIEPRLSRVSFIVGAGLVSRFFEIYDERGADGLVTAARIVARIFAGSFTGGRLARRVLEPASCELVVDDVPAPFDKVSLLCASVVANVGLGMRLLYRAEEAPANRFHVVATPLGPGRLGPQMPLVLAGKPLLGPRVDALAESISLRFPAGSGAYVVDGELVRGDAITITAGPRIDVLQI